MAKKKKRPANTALPSEVPNDAERELDEAEDDEGSASEVAKQPTPRLAATPLNPRPVRVKATASARRAQQAAQAAARGDYSAYGYDPVERRDDPVERREREIARIKREKEKKGHLELDVIRQRLANPTRVVTTEELAKEYGFVIRDLRSIGLLAGGLILLLVVLATVLPSTLG